MIYFSFVTLTTAGFGDILAVHKFAKIVAMLEAVTGVLYIAVTIGRLIGINRASRSMPDNKATGASHLFPPAHRFIAITNPARTGPPMMAAVNSCFKL